MYGLCWKRTIKNKIDQKNRTRFLKKAVPITSVIRDTYVSFLTKDFKLKTKKRCRYTVVIHWKVYLLPMNQNINIPKILSFGYKLAGGEPVG